MAEDTMDISKSIAVQQLRLIGLTDDILLSRTQISHQQKHVETCRNYLDESLKDLTAAISSQHSGGLSARKTKNFKNKKKKNKRAKEPENSLNTEPSPTAANMNDLDITLASPLEHGPEASTPQLTFPETKPSLEGLYEQFHTDSEALKTEETKLNDLMDALSCKEYQLAALHQHFAQRLRSKEFAGHLHSALEQLDLDQDQSISSHRLSGASSETPSLVAEYFDATGDVGVHEERIQDLEHVFHEGLVARNLISERGDYLSVSNMDFQANYDTRRRKHEDDLRVAQEKAAKLADRCLEAGLDFDKYRRHRPSVRAASTVGRPNSIFGSPILDDDILGVQRYSAYEIEPRMLTGSHSSSRVDNWLDGVATGVETTPIVRDEITVGEERMSVVDEPPSIVDETKSIAEERTDKAEATANEVQASSIEEHASIMGETSIAGEQRVVAEERTSGSRGWMVRWLGRRN